MHIQTVCCMCCVEGDTCGDTCFQRGQAERRDDTDPDRVALPPPRLPGGVAGQDLRSDPVGVPVARTPRGDARGRLEGHAAELLHAGGRPDLLQG